MHVKVPKVSEIQNLKSLRFASFKPFYSVRSQIKTVRSFPNSSAFYWRSGLNESTMYITVQRSTGVVV